MNKPKKLFRTSCGNGIVENDEECDCGLADHCTNPCCDASKCKLRPKAKCATGECCDKSTCQIIDKQQHHVCRSSMSVCDIAEVCDGQSEYCPQNVFIRDGTECLEGYAYCYAGKCESRNDQCKKLWGPSAEVADYRCFQHNLDASLSGDCGYDKVNRKHLNCTKASDIICGRLHCIHTSSKPIYGPEGATTISKSTETRKNNKIDCYSVIIDLGLNDTDPGMVPDGAKCGSSSMCVNQQCVPVEKFLNRLPCSNNCNNNGYCDNNGQCHCLDGYQTYDCSNSSILVTLFYCLLFVVLPIAIILYVLYTKNKFSVMHFLCKNNITNRDYHNRRPKTIPNVAEPTITLPLQRMPISAPQSTIKPVRPAPPPPARTTTTIPRASVVKPKNPPPPIPNPVARVQGIVSKFENITH